MEYQRILEMQIFFFVNFPLVHVPPSPILGCISTFMHDYTWNIYTWMFMRGLWVTYV